MIKFNGDAVRNLSEASKREWLETNGLGGFASSTIAGLNTRRYHGLLVAATKPPVGRMVLLSSLQETLIVDGRRYELSVNQYPGVVHPQGHLFLKQFRLDPYPVFTYEVDSIEIVKSGFMVQGKYSTCIRYDVRAGGNRGKVVLETRPLVAFRDYHSTTHENSAINREVQVERGLVSFAAYDGLPALRFAHDANDIDPDGFWYRSFEYAVERERGLDFNEDLFSPFALRFDMTSRSQAGIIASAALDDTLDATRIEEYKQAEISRRANMIAASPHEDEFVRSLVAAADQYIVTRECGKTVIAGYHWFGDWGRDTMIALPGLTLVTGRTEIAKSILLEFSQYVDQGMLPNRFPEAGEKPEYNTVDATLWFFEAIRAYGDYTGDYDFIREKLYPVLTEIIGWHVRGTRYGIKMDPSGLLAAGEPGVQLTWMDAKVGDWVVTPRSGKPVEIQALWYNALRVMEDLARRFGDEADQKRYRAMATLAIENFNRFFWNEKEACLYDVVNGGPPDRSIHPNQIFAVSLTHSMLPPERAKSVVEKVQEHLLTPYG